ncbi:MULTISPECIES: hydrogenase maturation protease [unclassified Streptomyces]|uniref:hydrogenase maturation protease n=1 Tax=unclassified Streptomyces TaxID=2593676 RepID=UPI00278C7034|nr:MULTISPECIES: hydrogenase maturation protease [unclassified Streptomyces]
MSAAARARIVVIGVGNEFRHDDGLGPAVVARLGTRAADRPLPPGTVLTTCDGEPGRLLGSWESAELAVVVDAAHAEPPQPGRVHRVELDDGALARPGPGPGQANSHGLGLGEAIELSRVLGRLPGRLVVYAVEGADRRVGTGLSPVVAERVDAVADAVEADIVRHRDAAARGGAARDQGHGHGGGVSV